MGSKVSSTNSKSSPSSAGQSDGDASKSSNEEPDGSGKGSNEAAFLWATTEKLYGSWAFRILGMMLIAAVLLASGGSYLIGGQTLHLREDIEKTGSAAKSDLEAIGKTTRETISEQSRNLTAEIARDRNEFGEKFAQATKTVDAFQRDAEALKKSAVEQIVTKIKDDLKQEESALRIEIALACCRFRRHRVRCFDGTGGGSWRDGSLRASSSLRL